MGQESTLRPRPHGRLARWRRSSWFVPVLLVALALIFIFGNRAETQIRFVVPIATMPIWSALLIVWIVGLLSGLWFSSRRKERR